MKLGQLIDVAIGNIIRKILAWFGGLAPKSGSFLINQPTTINQNKESHWLQDSATKILGDYSGNTKMPNWCLEKTCKKALK